MAIIKKVHQGFQDWWRSMARTSVWHKMSCGAEQRARMFSYPHGDQWRRTDKHQKNHDSHPHKSHKNR